MYNNTMKTLFYGRQYKRLVERETHDLAVKYDLNSIDLQIIMHLCNEDGKSTCSNIVSLDLFTKGYVSQSISRLQQRGLIKVYKDNDDRRCLHLELAENETIEALSREVANVQERITSQVFKGITGEEKEIMLQVLEKISDNLSEN